MRGGRAQTARGAATMNGVASVREEDRVRHRRVVPLLREVVALHPESLELAARRVVAALAGGDRPCIPRLSVDRDGHVLTRLVDGDLNGRAGGGRRKQRARQERGGKDWVTHGYPFPKTLTPVI